MVADHVQKRIAAHEIPRAVNRVAIAERPRLRDEANHSSVIAGRLQVAALIARPHHHANFLYLGGQRLFDQDREDRFLAAVPIDQGLQRKRALVGASGGNHRFLKSQVVWDSWKHSVTNGRGSFVGQRWHLAAGWYPAFQEPID